MQQLYTNPTFQAKYYQRINKVIALSLTSLSSAHQRETHVANFFLARDGYDCNCSGYV